MKKIAGQATILLLCWRDNYGGDVLNKPVAKKQNQFYGFRLLLSSLIFAALLLFSVSPSFSQDAPITATTNHTQYSTDDMVILSVTVINDDSPQQLKPILPPFDGLYVIDFDIATSVREVGGKIQTEVIYTYQLQPRRTGAITIPPIAVEVNGQIYETAPLALTVSQGNAPVPSAGHAIPSINIVPPAELKEHDFYVESVVDTETPYVGQQLIYTFRFYQALNLYQKPQYEMPIFNGLDTIGLPVQEYNLDFGDRTYLVTEIRMALFPTIDGHITIGPARLTLPGNFFEDPVELVTNPINLQVKSLPDGAPPGFRGAVGQFQIEAGFSPQVAVANQPSTYQVMITGIGNIKMLPQPIWPNLNGWRIFDSQSVVNADTASESLAGTRTFELVMASDRLGDFNIPPTKFVYFDPVAGQYQTISTKSMPVRIIPAPTPNPDEATAIAIQALPTRTPALSGSIWDSSPGADGSSVNPGLPDSLELSLPLALSLAGILFWAVCAAIPVAAIVGAGAVWVWQKQHSPTDYQVKEKTRELKQPSKKMHPALAAAVAETDDNYKAVAQALNGYLSDMLDMQVSGLTQTDLAKQLQEYGLPKNLTDNIKNYLAESEMGRFGPKNDDGWDLLARTDDVLLELDNIRKASGEG